MLGGGEATEPLAQWLAARLDLPCDVGTRCGPSKRPGRRPRRAMGRGCRTGPGDVINMHDIDFLPIEYRQKHARRQSQPWQIVVAAAIVGLVAAAAMAQHYRRHRVQSELAAITPVYDAAVDQQNRLAESRSGAAAKAGAELYTYLRHPWPRTQLLSALMAPLPEAIALQQMQILRETPAAGHQRPPGRRSTRKPRKSNSSRSPRPTRLVETPRPARPAADGRHAERHGHGSAALHRYIGDLDATDIFDKAELDCFNSMDNNKNGAVLQFRAVLAVQPGYGQPGGPTAPEKKDIAQNKTSRNRNPKAMPTTLRQSSWIVTLSLAAVAVAYVALLWLPGHRAIKEMREQVETKQTLVAQAAGISTELIRAQQELDKSESVVTRWEKAAPKKRDIRALWQDQCSGQGCPSGNRPLRSTAVGRPREAAGNSHRDDLLGDVRPDLRVSSGDRGDAGDNLG